MNYERQRLGAWSDLFSAGAGIFDSVMDSRTANQTNESMERQLQLQLQAQREQAAANQKLLKNALIGGGALLLGGVLIVVLTRPKKLSGVTKRKTGKKKAD